MSLDLERFETGLSFDQFMKQADLNRDRLQKAYDEVALDPGTVQVFRSLPQPLKVMALSEDWAADAVVSLPLLARLAEASEKLDLRIFMRDRNLDLMDQYLKEGKYRSIPVFVFFDAELRGELARYVERPPSLDAMHKQVVDRFIELHPHLTEEMAKPPEDRRDEVKRLYRGWVSEQFVQRHREIGAEVQKELRRLLGL